YTANSFRNPDKVRFRYKLEGLDDWMDAGPRRMASYSNLPPGSYVFRVIGANEDGVWNQTGAAFAFRLEPHFYQTIWFKTLLATARRFISRGHAISREAVWPRRIAPSWICARSSWKEATSRGLSRRSPESSPRTCPSGLSSRSRARRVLSPGPWRRTCFGSGR